MSEQSHDVADFCRRLGQRMRQVRQEAGYTLWGATDDLGDGWSYTVIANYERGERTITPERLATLARLYRVPINALLPKDTATDRWRLTFDIAQLQRLNRVQAGPLLEYLRVVHQLRNQYTDRLTLRPVIGGIPPVSLDNEPKRRSQ